MNNDFPSAQGVPSAPIVPQAVVQPPQPTVQSPVPVIQEQPTLMQRVVDKLTPHQGLPAQPIASNQQRVAPVKSPSMIQVVALEKGFYNQQRINPGEKFLVKDMKGLGKWMRCVNPEIQKVHEEAMKIKRENIVKSAKILK